MLGWVKLHRKILENGIFTGDSDLLKVFMWCLLKASHKAHQVGDVSLKEGQFVTGRIAASQELNIKPTTVRNKLMQLSRKKYITVQSTSKFSIITLCNWSTYQVDEPSEEKKVDLETKEHKFAEDVMTFTEYPEDMLQDFIHYWCEPNRSKTKLKFEMQKTWSTSRRLQTWFKRSEQTSQKSVSSAPKKSSKVAEGLDKWQKARQMMEQQNNNTNGS